MSHQGSITGLGAVDSIAQKLGKNQGLFQGAGSRPATPSPTPDTVLSREQVCHVPCVSAQGSKTHMHTPLLSQEDTPQLSSVRKGGAKAIQMQNEDATRHTFLNCACAQGQTEREKRGRRSCTSVHMLMEVRGQRQGFSLTTFHLFCCERVPYYNSPMWLSHLASTP